ncbi:hypothetical protein K474DRAFT_1750473 [Panus rudis PR-1116 ss-1]|nr:hypothetical protein K474DRAFT_1750473 [Panus rudis PR-1116 ss-1]
MSYARDALWESGHDESVEVNQRALIDKVLARYSGEFTVFRELLQNSADAASRNVEIHFETKDYLDHKAQDDASAEWRLPNLKNTHVHQWTFRNDGNIFREEDWSRLKKIAEGNPDEEKIGAFGVGFYSLFSVTEEPFVTSGGRWMGFYWKDKKDQLFARRGNLPEGARMDGWTTFAMPLREPMTMPPPFEFVRFLTSSITFVAHLTQVSVLLDGHLLAKIRREHGTPKILPLRPALKAESPHRSMRARSMEITPLFIKAEVMRGVYATNTTKQRRKSIEKTITKPSTSSGFFSSLFSSLAGQARSPTPQPQIDTAEAQRLEIAKREEEHKKLSQMTERNVALAVFSIDIDVSLDDRMRKELLRATKKSPPNKTRLELIFTGKEQYDASMKEDEQELDRTGSIFQGLRADIEGVGQARIFIGHTTGQTTGLGGHLSGRFIPTVERESVDLVDPSVKVWNEELLSMGGYLARSAYEVEMENIRSAWNTTSDEDKDTRLSLRARALHAMKFFTFYTSTPSPRVSERLEESFFLCAGTSTRGFAFLGASTPAPFPIISTSGVKDAHEVRMPNETFTAFLRRLPVVPDELAIGAQKMIAELRSRGMIQDIVWSDVINELKSRPLTESELVACLKWWIGVWKDGSGAAQLHGVRAELIDAAILITGGGVAEEKAIPLSTIRTFINTRGLGALILADGPLPPHLLPISVSQQFDPHNLASAMLWKELSILEWLEHLLSDEVASTHADFDPTKSAPFAERLLTILSRAWPSLSKDAQERIVGLLRPKECVPTSKGMKQAEQAYFETAHVFSDLPLVLLPSGAPVKGQLEKVLQALGVRRHVDLQIIFNRMIKTGDWSTSELVKYLVGVQSTLSSEELQRLSLTAAFPKEGQSDVKDNGKITRYKASDLYEPVDSMRKLGLPVLDWGIRTKWRGNSDEARFLYKLGLRRYPDLDKILSLASGVDEAVRPLALAYFLDNLSTKYIDYSPTKFAHIAFIPSIKGGQSYLGKPNEIFLNPVWASLGFGIIDTSKVPRDAMTKLQIREHPPSQMFVRLLQTSPPTDEKTAQTWFEALAGRVSEFSAVELKLLSGTPFVPITSVGHGDNPSVRLLQPTQCYFKNQSSAQVHSKLFTFVDFGPGNLFLGACGTKHEPSVEEIAKILLDDPRRFFELANGRDNYLSELLNIAVNRRLISPGTITRMKRAPILLASRRIKRSRTEKKGSLDEFDEEDDWDLEYDLMRPSSVAVVDDTNAYQLFGEVIFSAPQEDRLEEFYLELGSVRLSSLVKEKYRTSTEARGDRRAKEIRSLILERLPLFLHEHPHARTKVPFSWLNNDSNFVVKTYGKITVIKTLSFGQINASKNHDASAVATQEGRGPIQLWLAGNDTIDLYEVSTSMCRLLFHSPKPSDALLFMTILSTDLKSLRRRGYNVDRILRKQKAEREAAEATAREKAKQTALVSHQKAPQVVEPTMPVTNPEIGQLPESSSKDTLPPISTAIQPTLPANQGLIDKPISRSFMDSWRQKLTGQRHQSEGHASLPSANQDLRPNIPSASRPRSPLSAVTPWSAIAANIDTAIRACKEEKGEMLQNRAQMQMVKEALNEGYCDISGRAGDLTLIGEYMGGVKVYLTQDVPDPSSVLQKKRDALARFIHISRNLVQVYGLPSSSVHIFLDVTGDLIAFNRNASLFLNLRFFETWHDAEVSNGDLFKAYVSWYFTLAHEIAHNLVQPHNSEHEFYFSSICEAYMPALTRLLMTSQS